VAVSGRQRVFKRIIESRLRIKLISRSGGDVKPAGQAPQRDQQRLLVQLSWQVPQVSRPESVHIFEMAPATPCRRDSRLISVSRLRTSFFVVFFIATP
jgi:hypothetical protein